MKRRWITAAVVTLMIVIPTAATARTTGSHARHIPPGRPILDYRFPGTRSLASIAAAGTGIKRFTANVTDGTKTFAYTLVGKNPAKAQTNPVTNIQTELIPIKVVLSNNDTYDPTVADTCDAGAPAITRVEQSPIFASRGYTWGGTKVDTGQYVDAFRRAEFWKYTKKTGINPGYHVNLVPTTLPAIEVDVPNGDSTEYGPAPCGEKLASIEINWFDNYLHTTLLPAVSADVTPGTFPIFVFRNVVMYDTLTTNCCILGYHSATNTVAGVQTYGTSNYDTTPGGQFFSGGVQDASTLAHEVGEWMDDPFGTNPTKPWGNIGQVTGCQGNLEVGDPLSGTMLNVTASGFAYHPQELAFFSWFYHQKPSLGVNGWYSNADTFTTPAKKCP
jgi:hypothetical protein